MNTFSKVWFYVFFTFGPLIENILKAFNETLKRNKFYRFLLRPFYVEDFFPKTLFSLVEILRCIA
jgi:hypothetical protein